MSHKLLVADEDDGFCEALCRELAADGDEATVATTPRALALGLERRRPDLLVLGDFEGPGAAARLLAALRGGGPPFRGLCSETPAIVLAETAASSRCCAPSRRAPTTSSGSRRATSSCARGSGP